MLFLLGTHKAHWLSQPAFAGVPLFISHRTLAARKAMPGPVTTTWALDSGGFTQLQQNPDGWPAGCEEPYAEAVYRYREAGGLLWASQQDWMAEPFMLNGRTVAEHQDRTVANYLRLVEIAPDLPWLPVLQGWELKDYHDHVDQWSAAGIDLAALPLVGLGSVCRRQHTDQIETLITSLAARGLRLHGFGVKALGLRRYSRLLASADSLAWSYRARRNPGLPGCRHGRDGTGHCQNCPLYALDWRTRTLSRLREGPADYQAALW